MSRFYHWCSVVQFVGLMTTVVAVLAMIHQSRVIDDETPVPSCESSEPKLAGAIQLRKQNGDWIVLTAEDIERLLRSVK
jgi:hypothetical protein